MNAQSEICVTPGVSGLAGIEGECDGANPKSVRGQRSKPRIVSSGCLIKAFFVTCTFRNVTGVKIFGLKYFNMKISFETMVNNLIPPFVMREAGIKVLRIRTEPLLRT